MWLEARCTWLGYGCRPCYHALSALWWAPGGAAFVAGGAERVVLLQCTCGLLKLCFAVSGGAWRRGIEEAPKAATVEERGEILNEYFTFSLYVNICRSLFEAHKLMFSLLLAVKILQNQGAPQTCAVHVPTVATCHTRLPTCGKVPHAAPCCAH